MRLRFRKAGILIGSKVSVNRPLGQIRVFFHKVIIESSGAAVKRLFEATSGAKIRRLPL